MNGFEKLYTNIGDKIKNLATCLFVLGSVLSALFGIVMIARSYGPFGMVLCGVAYLAVRDLLSWIASWLLYGIGTLIEKICLIERLLCLLLQQYPNGNK